MKRSFQPKTSKKRGYLYTSHTPLLHARTHTQTQTHTYTARSVSLLSLQDSGLIQSPSGSPTARSQSMSPCNGSSLPPGGFPSDSPRSALTRKSLSLHAQSGQFAGQEASPRSSSFFRLKSGPVGPFGLCLLPFSFPCRPEEHEGEGGDEMTREERRQRDGTGREGGRGVGLGLAAPPSLLMPSVPRLDLARFLGI